jgi:hypothetical protein
MKKLLLIIAIFIFAGLTKSYAYTYSYGWNFEWDWDTNQTYGTQSLNFYGLDITVAVEAYPVAIGDGWGYNIQIMDLGYNTMASLIDGGYNGPEYSNSGSYSYQSIDFSNSNVPQYIWIRTHYVTGSVGLFW